MVNVLTLSLLIVSAPVPASASAALDTIRPIISVPLNSMPTAGETEQVTVSLSGPALGNEDVVITNSNPGFYASMPTDVYPAAGATSVTFLAVVSANPSGSCTITSTLNGYSASCTTTAKLVVKSAPTRSVQLH